MYDGGREEIPERRLIFTEGKVALTGRWRVCPAEATWVHLGTAGPMLTECENK